MKEWANVIKYIQERNYLLRRIQDNMKEWANVIKYIQERNY